MKAIMNVQPEILEKPKQSIVQEETVNLSRLDPRDHSEWNDLLLASSDYSIFHTSNWAQVLIDSYDCRPHYLGHIDADRFRFLLPLMTLRSWMARSKAIGLPYSDYCRPIVSANYELSRMLPQIAAYAQESKWNILHFRGGQFSENNIEPESQFFQHVLPLSTDGDPMFSRLRGNYRSKIKKAIKKGVSIQRRNDADALDTYYRLHCITRKRQGLPPQPAKFFKAIFDNIIAKGMGTVILASCDGQPAAGAVYFHFGEKVVYKFGALDIGYQKLNPSYLVMWHAIESYGQEGYKELCFGRTETDHDGLVQYKDGWGCDRHLLDYHVYKVAAARFLARDHKIKQLGYTVFQKMPLPVLRICGRLLYPHVG